MKGQVCHLQESILVQHAAGCRAELAEPGVHVPNWPHLLRRTAHQRMGIAADAERVQLAPCVRCVPSAPHRQPTRMARTWARMSHACPAKIW